jgi:hypothetical protein
MSSQFEHPVDPRADEHHPLCFSQVDRERIYTIVLHAAEACGCKFTEAVAIAEKALLEL